MAADKKKEAAPKAKRNETPAAKSTKQEPKLPIVEAKGLVKTTPKKGEKEIEPSLKGEYGNIALLVLLYTLQGIPMGIFGYVNMEVKSIFKNSFSEQGTFMLAVWPFSLKLLWAPMVDTWYFSSIGRRKTWMVPAQFAIGVILLLLASSVEDLFVAKDVTTLTISFFGLYFLCATQDIAVDGWALTMLRTENAGYASTCNAVGQTVGFTLGFMLPMAKLVAFPTFLLFWGTVFVAVTLAVAVFKTEEPARPEEEPEGLQEAYGAMYRMARLRPVQLLALHLLTRALAFVPADIMAAGRLQDAGFPKETLASIKLFVTPLEIVMPWLLSPFTAGPRPLTSVLLVAFLPRVGLTLLGGIFSFYVDGAIASPVPTAVYAMVFALTIAQGVLSNAMFVAHMAFFAKVSDPAIGGTYMTFLNTVHNLGSMWATQFCLKVADRVQDLTGFQDGYQFLCIACAGYGVLWFFLFRPMLSRIQDLPVSEWRVG